MLIVVLRSDVGILTLLLTRAQLGPSHFHRDLRDAMREIESLGYGNSVVSRYT
jgi:hypothetical protein